jgi:hypothetical protein
VKRGGYDLVVLDTISSFWPVQKENDAGEVQSALMPLWQITDAGVATLLVHHLHKSDGGEATASRGSGAPPAFVDVIVELRRHDPNDLKDRRRVLTAVGRFDDTPPELVVELTDQGYLGRLAGKGGRRVPARPFDLAWARVVIGLDMEASKNFTSPEAAPEGARERLVPSNHVQHGGHVIPPAPRRAASRGRRWPRPSPSREPCVAASHPLLSGRRQEALPTGNHGTGFRPGPWS